MHILFICADFPYPENSPHKFALMEIVRALYLHKVQITILAQYSPEQAVDIETLPAEMRKWANYYAIEVETPQSFLASVANFLLSAESAEIKSYFSAGFAKQIEKILAENTIDVVQLEGLQMAVYQAVIPATIKQILRIQDFDFTKYKKWIAFAKNFIEKNYHEVSQKKWEDWAWKHVLSGKFHRILLPDSSFKKDIIAQLSSRKGIAPSVFVPIHGIDLSRIQVSENLSVEPNSVYWMGSLDLEAAQKALSWFLTHIWAKVWKEYPQAKLYIAARSRPENFMLDITAAQGVYWEGIIANIYDFMASKAIMVLPLQQYWGQQMKLLEAMAVGNAIVASSPALQALPAKQGDTLFIADTEQRFIQLLSTLIEHPNIAQTLGNHAKAWVNQHLSQAKIAERTMRFYQGL